MTVTHQVLFDLVESHPPDPPDEPDEPLNRFPDHGPISPLLAVTAVFPCTTDHAYGPAGPIPHEALHGLPFADAFPPWGLMPKTPYPVACKSRSACVGLPPGRNIHRSIFACLQDRRESQQPYRTGRRGPVAFVGSSLQLEDGQKADKKKPRNCYQQSGAVFGSHPFQSADQKVPICSVYTDTSPDAIRYP